MAISRNLSGCHDGGGAATGAQWVEAKEAAWPPACSGQPWRQGSTGPQTRVVSMLKSPDLMLVKGLARCPNKEMARSVLDIMIIITITVNRSCFCNRKSSVCCKYDF